jgi:hypothetical protein
MTIPAYRWPPEEFILLLPKARLCLWRRASCVPISAIIHGIHGYWCRQPIAPPLVCGCLPVQSPRTNVSQAFLPPLALYVPANSQHLAEQRPGPTPERVCIELDHPARSSAGAHRPEGSLALRRQPRLLRPAMRRPALRLLGLTVCSPAQNAIIGPGFCCSILPRDVNPLVVASFQALIVLRFSLRFPD